MKRCWKAIAVSVALAAFGATNALALEPSGTSLRSGGKPVLSTQGSSCWLDPAKGSTLCADMAYPLPVRCSLPAKGGTKLVVTTGSPATDVSAMLVVPTGGPMPKLRKLPPWKGATAGTPGTTTWRFRMRRAAESSAAVSVFGTYPQGDSNTWTGLATRACRDSGYGGSNPTWLESTAFHAGQ